MSTLEQKARIILDQLTDMDSQIKNKKKKIQLNKCLLTTQLTKFTIPISSKVEINLIILSQNKLNHSLFK